MIDSSTQICMSLAARPGTFGNRFHNYLYGELRLNFVYRSGLTQDLTAAVAGLRALGIRGCGLSMPYKEAVIELLDAVDPVASEIGAVNTIVNEEGRLTGHNTDHVAAFHQLKNRGVGPRSKVALHGSGGMARAVAYALNELGCRDVVIVARNSRTGRALAERYSFRYLEPGAELPGEFEVLINASPVGMAPDALDRIPFALEVVRAASLIVDAVAYPPETTLLRTAREAGRTLVAGFDLTVSQAVEQFRLYTGVSLRPDQVGRAAVFARHSV